jgi:hypothetical protein
MWKTLAALDLTFKKKFLHAAEQDRDDPLVGVKRLVGDQHLGAHGGQKVVGADQIMRLAIADVEADRAAKGIDHGVDFGAQSAA